MHREDDVGRVLQTSARSGITGYDLVFAAPRAVSILLAVDPAAGSALVAAQRASVGAALSYLERRALVVPVTRWGERFGAPASWSAVVSFTHGINRAGEPHLHDHVLVGARPDGHAGVLDGHALRTHLPAADALYRAALREEVNLATTWRVWSRRGHEHVSDLDEGYRTLWPGHDDERRPKRHWARSEALGHWRDDLRRMTPIAMVSPPTERDFDPHAYAAAFEGALTIHRSDLVRAWADASPYGARPDKIDEAIDRVHPTLRYERGHPRRSLAVAEARRTVGWGRELAADMADDAQRMRIVRSSSRAIDLR